MNEKICTYQFKNGENCRERLYGNSPYCILHVDFPDKTTREFEEVRQKKMRKFERKLTQKIEILSSRVQRYIPSICLGERI